MRKSLILVKTTLVDQFRNFDFLVVIVLLAAYYSFVLPKSCSSLLDASDTVNPLAPFIIKFLSRDFHLITFVGLIMMTSDMSDKIVDKTYRILRMNRKEWIRSQIISMVAGVLIYFIMVLVLTALFFLPVLEFGSSWGSGIENGSFFTSEAYQMSDLYGSNIYVCFFKAFLLVVLLGILFGSICLLAESFGMKKIGPAICAALMVWDLMVKSTVTYSRYITPVGMMESYAEGNFLYAVLYYAVFILIILNLVWAANRNSEF